jgi:uncharacterized protein GlcG (DUF336 family)
MKTALILFATLFTFAQAQAQTCKELPNHDALQKALVAAQKEANGGLGLHMWGSIVDRSGVVCAVAYTGATVDAQWPGSRLISAEKAYTANAFSLAASALSTANLYSGVQPGGFLFGLENSQPMNTDVIHKGSAKTFGSKKDPLVGERVGGVITFGGGLALYDAKGAILGGIGVSGDTSCADHNIAWRLRHGLNLDFVPGGVAPDKNDAIIYDIEGGKSKSGFGHPGCIGTEKDVAKTLPAIQKKKAE